ncbi:large ribosomal subunit protein mL63 [Achroia grisella]|uniref:large ribosomal subunit protein mL63 n=1 Tax=Achroia grisella TaxID=688607 RepID=UPI0027D25492|nr:large ribosomal subunit protein mL63 [Achroia grisella]
MRITTVLFRRNRLPNGHLFRGKDRLVKKVETKHLNRIKQDFAVEEQNMFYLRFPYLSEVESSGHAKALGKREQRKEKILEQNHRYFKEDVTLYERLKHLRVSEGWE